MLDLGIGLGLVLAGFAFGYGAREVISYRRRKPPSGDITLSRLVAGPPRLTIPRSAPRGQIGQSREIVATLESRFRRQLQTQQSRRNPSQHFPLDSCNENLPEKRIHRNYASRPGGMPRRAFCCAPASRGRARRILVRQQKIRRLERSHAVGSRGPRQGDRRLRGGARDERLRGTPDQARKRDGTMKSGTSHRTRGREQGDANRRLQKRAAIVSRLFFTMKKPTRTCGGANNLLAAHAMEVRTSANVSLSATPSAPRADPVFGRRRTLPPPRARPAGSTPRRPHRRCARATRNAPAPA